MASLKDYRDRIASVKSTRKITSAMKMVAASKLKRAQESAEASQPYATAMAGMLGRVAGGAVASGGSNLLVGTGQDKTHLLIVVSSDRGLCGGFNGNIVRFALKKIQALLAEGHDVKIVTIGRKAQELLKREYADKIVKSFLDIGTVKFTDAADVSDFVLSSFDAGEFDVCSLIYNDFKSVLAQIPMAQQLIPFSAPVVQDNEPQDNEKSASAAPYDFEPDEEKLLKDLLPRNISIQIFRSMLDSAAGEQAARMTAMDNATRNAGDMINDLSLQYNRARQAYITKELIEIISGAEAL